MAGCIAGKPRRSNSRGTRSALRGMKKSLALVVVCTLASVCAAEERPTLRDREAPRATDLLRAEKLAEQARKRLQQPAARHPARWEGGGGTGGAEGREP